MSTTYSRLVSTTCDRVVSTTHSRLVSTTHDRIDVYHGPDVAADYDDVAGKAAGMPDISLRRLRWR